MNALEIKQTFDFPPSSHVNSYPCGHCCVLIALWHGRSNIRKKVYNEQFIMSKVTMVVAIYLRYEQFDNKVLVHI